MKTALCVSGQARGVSNGWQNIFHNLVKPNDPDIFVHIWGRESDAEVIAIRDLYKPLSMVVEEPRKFVNSELDIDRQYARWPFGANRDDFVDRTYSMWYSVLQANLVKEKHRLATNTHYDCVMRARTDINFSRPIECATYDLSAIHLTDKNIPEMVDDRFAFGPNNLMNIYSSGFCMYDHINKIRSAKDGIFCAEIILFEMFKTFNIDYRFIPNLIVDKNR